MLRGVAVVVVTLGATAGCVGGDDDAESSAPVAVSEPFEITVDDRAATLGAAADIDVVEAASEAADAVFAHLPDQERISISISVNPARAIPEVGVGGFTDPALADISIWIDDTASVPLADVLTTWLPATIAHEGHHASRIQVGPGYGRSLAEAIVTEGLADRFVLEVFPTTPAAPWSQALDAQQRVDVWNQATPQLHASFYDHSAWFFGAGDVPRWAGYTIGFDAVGRYLATHDTTPSKLIEVSANDVLDDYDPAAPAAHS